MNFIDTTDWSRWHPRDNHLGFYIPKHHRTSSYHCMFADDCGPDYRSVAGNPCARTNNYITAFRWNSRRPGAFPSFGSMRSGKETNVVTEYDIVLDSNTSRRNIQQSIVDARTWRNRNAGFVAEHDVFVKKCLPNAPSHSRPPYQPSRQTFKPSFSETDTEFAHRDHLPRRILERLSNRRS